MPGVVDHLIAGGGAAIIAGILIALGLNPSITLQQVQRFNKTRLPMCDG